MVVVVVVLRLVAADCATSTWTSSWLRSLAVGKQHSLSAQRSAFTRIKTLNSSSSRTREANREQHRLGEHQKLPPASHGRFGSCPSRRPPRGYPRRVDRQRDEVVRGRKARQATGAGDRLHFRGASI
ncbi:hypothetical protein V8E36_007472 [Tilletia maclaganii]